ncbi:MAG: helix-turn-helix domain-containing protein [Anaerolineales bacterium]|nr:helix-turn-helix domain-containing protein [Anaerolineales bacterium]
MPAKWKDVPKKGETTRLAIEDASVELFMENGYHATSMRQIAEHAGLALGGIYNHFRSKEEIFEAIIVDKHPYKRILPSILEAQGETVEDFMKNAAQISMVELKKQPYYLNLMFIEFVEFNGKHGALLLREIAPKVLPIFEKLVKSRKELRITNPAMLVRSFFGLIISFMLTEMIIGHSHLNALMPKNPMDAYVDIYLHGVLKEPK